MRAYVDPELCIGCGLCPSLCPEVFYMENDDLARAKDIEIPKEADESAKNARDNCPVDAISIEE